MRQAAEAVRTQHNASKQKPKDRTDLPAPKQRDYNAGCRQKQDNVLVGSRFDASGHGVSVLLATCILAHAACLQKHVRCLECCLVKRPASRPMSVSAERRAVIALFAAFALLVQALIPSLASAAPMSNAGMVICTEQGIQAAPPGSVPGPAPADHACQHCICATPAIEAQESAAASTPVRYTPLSQRVVRDDTILKFSRVLAAPPPPSRGPPAS